MPENAPITLRTFGDLLRHGYRLTAHCPSCRVFRDVDLEQCPPDRPHIGARFKCRICGGPGSVTLSQIVTGGEAHLDALARWRAGDH